MGNGYYYTLSAIAQSFAALIALDAIFVTFKWKTIQDTIEALSDQTRRLIIRDRTRDAHNRTDEMIQEREVSKLTNEQLFKWLASGEIESNLPELKTKQADLCVDANETERTRVLIVSWLYVSLALNSATILLSLVFLPFGVVACAVFQWLIVGMILLLSMVTLLITVNAIIITIRGEGISRISNVIISFMRLIKQCDFADQLMSIGIPNK